MMGFTGALDRGPRPLELPIHLPRPAPHRRGPVVEIPGDGSTRTRIEIDLVDDEQRRHDDADEANRSTVIEIDLA